jgi:2-phospho-L-lactate guanylyltransferase
MPVKVLAHAKSRLAVLAGARRRDLALALACDTVTAVLACRQVTHVLAVTSDPEAAGRLSELGADVVADEPGDGLNAALRHGAERASRRWPGTGLAAVAADLPALRPGELGRALSAAESFPASFVPDAAATGTTMYAVPPSGGGVFRPMFGGASRARHAAAGAAELAVGDIPGLRRDVDTPDDLRAACALGAGFRTVALADELLGASGV